MSEDQAEATPPAPSANDTAEKRTKASAEAPAPADAGPETPEQRAGNDAETPAPSKASAAPPEKKTAGKGKQVALAVVLVGVLFVLLVFFYLTQVGVVEFTYQGY